MKGIGLYKHRNPARPDLWVERFRGEGHRLRFYKPTPSSRRRIARLIKTMPRVTLSGFWIFTKR